MDGGLGLHFDSPEPKSPGYKCLNFRRNEIMLRGAFTLTVARLTFLLPAFGTLVPYPTYRGFSGLVVELQQSGFATRRRLPN